MLGGTARAAGGGKFFNVLGKRHTGMPCTNKPRLMYDDGQGLGGGECVCAGGGIQAVAEEYTPGSDCLCIDLKTTFCHE